jgi:hypothetical protein
VVAGSTFETIIVINEHIKEVEALSRQVNLEAINAALSARRVGSQGKGFATVASELQRFSHALDDLMGKQLAVNNVIIQLMAHRCMVDTRLRVLGRDADYTTCLDVLMGTISKLYSEREHINCKIKDEHDKMHVMCIRMRKYCNVGRAISKSAMIEAAHCGAYMLQLRQVAEAMDDAISQIMERLDMLMRIDSMSRNESDINGAAA